MKLSDIYTSLSEVADRHGITVDMKEQPVEEENKMIYRIFDMRASIDLSATPFLVEHSVEVMVIMSDPLKCEEVFRDIMNTMASKGYSIENGMIYMNRLAVVLKYGINEGGRNYGR